MNEEKKMLDAGDFSRFFFFFFLFWSILNVTLKINCNFCWPCFKIKKYDSDVFLSITEHHIILFHPINVALRTIRRSGMKGALTIIFSRQ